MSLAKEYLSSVIKRFREYRDLGQKTFDQLDDQQMLFTPNETSNSIGVIIQHMHGNMLSRWTSFLTEDGEKEWRDRDGEFEPRTLTKQQLIDLWNEGWDLVLNTLESLQEEDLTRTITIRTQPLSVVDAINRQLAHYSSHVGQIVYLGKWLRDQEWKTLSIPKKASRQFNQQMKQSRH